MARPFSVGTLWARKFAFRSLSSLLWEVVVITLQPLNDLRYIRHVPQAWAHGNGPIASHCKGLRGLPISAPRFTGEGADPLLFAAQCKRAWSESHPLSRCAAPFFLVPGRVDGGGLMSSACDGADYGQVDQGR